MVHTIVDWPQGFANCVPCVWEATHPELALVRLHGRNHDTWNLKGPASSSRFDYWYSSEELAVLKPEILTIWPQGEQSPRALQHQLRGPGTGQCAPDEATAGVNGT